LNFAPTDANRQAPNETRRELGLTASVLDMAGGDPDLATGFQASPTKAINRGNL